MKKYPLNCTVRSTNRDMDHETRSSKDEDGNLWVGGNYGELNPFP